METIDINGLANAVAMVEYYNEIIETEKAKIRNLSTKDIEKLNKNNLVIIKPSDYTKTIYSNEYKEEVKKLQEKYPPTKETISNHSIKLTATSFAKRKAEEIRKFSKYNITTLKQAAASINKNKIS